mmetsp:Transcript_90613/g.194292  ORF Transcript_90613/g.194292 Transcript_90613/m.194292 type:complete len:377 (+) Transcript_90613:168-1298(+)
MLADAVAEPAMQTLHNRMGKSLRVSTKESAGTCQGVPAENCKTIRCLTEAQVQKLYKLKGWLDECAQPGTELRFATRISDGLEVVIKIRRKGFSQEAEWRSNAKVQLNMPASDNTCALLDIIETNRYYYVVMEKVEGRDLFEQARSTHLNISDTHEILRQIIKALEFMHEMGRIHRDVKLENVMVNMEAPMSPTSPESPAVKIIDFDTVSDWDPLSPKSRELVGTDIYLAPEAYGGDFSPASDMYSVGVIMYKMLTGSFPLPADIFDGPRSNFVGSPEVKRIHQRVCTHKIDFHALSKTSSPLGADLCQKLLAFDPRLRPSAEECLRHEWFDPKMARQRTCTSTSTSPGQSRCSTEEDIIFDPDFSDEEDEEVISI